MSAAHTDTHVQQAYTRVLALLSYGKVHSFVSGVQESETFLVAVVRLFLGLESWNESVKVRKVSTLPYFDGYVMGNTEPFVMFRFGYEQLSFIPFTDGISGGPVDGMTAVPHVNTNGLIVVVGKIQGYWQGPHSLRYGMQENPKVLHRDRYLNKDVFLTEVQSAIVGAEQARAAEYKECGDCHRLCYPEYRDSRGMCMGCAQEKQGIVY